MALLSFLHGLPDLKCIVIRKKRRGRGGNSGVCNWNSEQYLLYMTLYHTQLQCKLYATVLKVNSIVCLICISCYFHTWSNQISLVFHDALNTMMFVNLTVQQVFVENNALQINQWNQFFHISSYRRRQRTKFGKGRQIERHFNFIHIVSVWCLNWYLCMNSNGIANEK